ncbi:bifunctional tetrahydrofolate synthase/dihydrofolate synthase [Aromatoleum diolicum]|uniref:Dihydrofolate synthase/folylpolyglutamate synthase n=1 Tax=Aromatoleum diolicum TaxID=75796 RepID=A0ABX1QBB7_9RHOO|nr:bifunctional tetrahydrofolate synthase/dihydrofolate synthase [Aromatoleum diolicum]NMG74810.1 bifunctional tetrahydrofolate synthase/dihydrofolate synthase [Aromatoleum diolicum]
MRYPDSLNGWLELLEGRHSAQIQLGLERVAHVRDALAVRCDAVVITVGGTNGKGSTCAMLEAILLAAGYRVGCYTSPHLLRFNERVRIDGRELEDAALVEGFAAVERVRDEIPLTYFEHGTLAAWYAFSREPLDVIILEVGLGGRLDAVNAIEPDCAVVTGVAMDHMDYLGETREQIGFEKAGIFRAGRPAICSDPLAPVSLVAHAREIGADLCLVGQDFGFSGDRTQWVWWSRGGVRRGGLAYPALRGANQLLNASAALMALEKLRDRIPVSMQAVRQGLMLVELPGRFQVLAGKPSVVLDVAHNPQAAGVLSENLSNMGFFPETWAVLGMLSDKDVEGVVRLIQERVDHWLLTGLPGPRGLTAEALADRLRSVGVRGDVQCFKRPAEAFSVAQESAGEGDRIVVFGSFLTVADVLDAVRAARH